MTGYDRVRTLAALLLSLVIHILVAVVLRSPDPPGDQKMDEPLEMVVLDLPVEQTEELIEEPAEEPIAEPAVEPAMEPLVEPDPIPEEVGEKEQKPERVDEVRVERRIISADQERLILLEYTRRVRSRIEEEKHYPIRARRREQTGEVVVRFSIDRHGQIMDGPEVYRPSRYAALNNAALEAVKKAVPYPGFPAELKQERMAFEVPIRFSLDI